MAEQEDFRATQYAFAAHIRDPHHVPAPAGIEDRRMAIYRELFFNNLRQLLSGMFPVLKAIHADDHWRRMIRRFMVHHQAETPYFLQLPKEFIAFLESDAARMDDEFPFLLELANYEWLELELSVSTAENDLGAIEADGDLLQGIPVKSNLAWLHAYQYPVHRISKSYLPEAPGEQPTFIAVYRQADDELGFMELNAVTAQLLQLIDDNDDGKTGHELLLDLAKQLNFGDTDALISHGIDAMQNLRDKQILLGTRKQTA